MVSGAAMPGDADFSESIRGAVTQLDAQAGIEGWAADRHRPDSALAIELWAGGRRLASCTTGLIRGSPGAEGGDASGFSFAGDALDALRRAAAEGRRGPVEVRVAGHDRPLPLDVAPLALEFIEVAEAASRRGRDGDFLARLTQLRHAAAAGLQQDFRPEPGSRAGFVEAAAIDAGGLVWVVGWIENDSCVDRPMIVVDGARTAAGFACMLVPRDDLPPNAMGFVGVVHGDWRPRRDGKAFLFLDGGNGRHLESLEPLNLLSKAGLIAHCAPLWARGGAGHAPALRRLMQQVRGWDVLPADFAPEMAAVEEVLVLPGFGCFVAGWTLSPTKQLERLALRLGDAVLVSDPGSTVHKSRPDLAGIFPGADRLVAHAGFTAVFPGQLDPDSLGNAVLKAIYRDGTASNHPIPASAMRRLGESVDWDRVRLLYPSITAEPFFPAFAAGVRAHHTAAARQVDAIAVGPCNEAVVLAAPRGRSDAFLMFDGIAQHEAQLAAGTGIVVLAGEDCDRATLIALFGDLRAATDRPLSLMRVAEAAMAPYALPEAARQIGFERFLFVGADAMLTPYGWRAAAALDGALALIELDDPAREGAASEAGLSAFAWSVAAYRDFLSRAAPRVGGPPAPPPGEARRVARGAWRMGTAAHTSLIEAIDAIGEAA